MSDGVLGINPAEIIAAVEGAAASAPASMISSLPVGMSGPHPFDGAHQAGTEWHAAARASTSEALSGHAEALTAAAAAGCAQFAATNAANAGEVGQW